MRYFISYKYTNNENKDKLKEELEEISNKVESWGDQAFVLGRDVKKWKHVHLGTFKLIPAIYNNMKSCDVVYFFIDTPAFSKGVMFEAIIATLLGKKKILFSLKGINAPLLSLLVDKKIEIESYKDINKVE